MLTFEGKLALSLFPFIFKMMFSLCLVFSVILQSIKMFEETIIDGGNYVAVSCPNFEDFDSGICCNGQDFARMGEKIERDKRGKYYLNTARGPPYALSKEKSINCVPLMDVI